MIEYIAAGLLLAGVVLLLAMAPLALVWLLHAHGLITQEEAERAIADMANGTVRL